MTKLTQTIHRLEIHVRALAAAAAQAQLAFDGTPISKRGTGEWSNRYDTLAHNLAEAALDELAALRALSQARSN